MGGHSAFSKVRKRWFNRKIAPIVTLEILD